MAGDESGFPKDIKRESGDGAGNIAALQVIVLCSVAHGELQLSVLSRFWGLSVNARDVPTDRAAKPGIVYGLIRGWI